MATLHVTLGTTLTKFQRAGVSNEFMPVTPSTVRAAETMTTTGTSAASTIVGGAGEVWIITARDADHWISFGSAPTAASGTGFLLMAGTTREFGVVAGHKVAARTV